MAYHVSLKVFKSIKLSHSQIRYLLIPPLALVLVHLVSYGKLPFDKGYQFPLIPFVTACFLVLICCEINTRNYHRLSKRFSPKANPIKAITGQLSSSLVITTLVFAVVVYSLNYFIFGHISTFSKFLSSLFIALLIVSIETLIYIIGDFRKAQQDQTQETNLIWSIASGQKTVQVKAADVAFIYSQGGLVYFVLQDGSKLLSQFTSFNQASDALELNDFFKVNRQFLIRKEAVREIQKEQNQKLKISLTPKVNGISDNIIVSRYTAPDFKKWINQ